MGIYIYWEEEVIHKCYHGKLAANLRDVFLELEIGDDWFFDSDENREILIIDRKDLKKLKQFLHDRKAALLDIQYMRLIEAGGNKDAINEFVEKNDFYLIKLVSDVVWCMNKRRRVQKFVFKSDVY